MPPKPLENTGNDEEEEVDPESIDRTAFSYRGVIGTAIVLGIITGCAWFLRMYSRNNTLDAITR